MKLAIAIADKSAPPSAFVVWRGFEESIPKAAALGYDGVELALRDAEQINANPLAKCLARNNMSVSAITTGQVLAVSQLYFTHADVSVRAKTQEVFKGLVDVAADFAPILNIGRARGFVEEGSSPAQTRTLFYETVRPVLEYAHKKGVTLIIEPVNRYEINFINSVDDCVALINGMPFEKTLCPYIGVMPDVFHMNIEDDSIGGALERAGELVKYVHFADSNRLSPGSGHIDFEEVLRALARIGYNGWASVEILPKPDPDEAARRAASFLLPKVKIYRPNR